MDVDAVNVYTPGGRLLWTVAVPPHGVSAINLVSSAVGWLRLNGRLLSPSEMILPGTDIVYVHATNCNQVSIYHAGGSEICKVEIPESGKRVSDVLAVGSSGRLVRNGARLGSKDLVFPGEQGLGLEPALATAGHRWVALQNMLLGNQPKMVAGDVFKPGTVLSVPPIPGMEEIHQGSLWVHPQYAAINAALEKLMADGGTKRVHVIGTAGTGKSAFAVIKMYDLAQQGARVVYRPINETMWLYFDFSHGTVFRGRELEDFEDVIDDETWVVVDGASKPVLHTGPLLQCVSDRKAGHHEIGKRGAYLSMEAWSMDECKQCNAALGLGVEDLAAKYYYIGGIPRSLFNKRQTPETLKRRVDGTISKLGNKGFNGFMDNMVGKGETVSNVLFHYKYTARDAVPIDPAVWEFKPASSYVELRADETQKVNTDERRKKWLLENIGNADAAVYRGWRFERYAHGKLRQGGSFSIKNLQTGTRSEVDVQVSMSSAIYEWDLYSAATTLVNIQGQPRSTLSRATLGSRHYVHPVIKNQSSYDSFWVEEVDTTSRTQNYRVRMFQMCVGLDHPVKWDAVRELMKRLTGLYGPNARVDFEFFFVVPRENMDTFERQEFLVKDRSHVYDKVPAAAKKLKQFALEIGFR